MDEVRCSPPPRIQIGSFEVVGLIDGYFWLDGGAMHGTVPRVLWQVPHPPDEFNRIRLGLRSLLIRGPGLTAIVETGLGSHHDPRFAERFRVVQQPGLVSALAREGVGPADVDLVINAHLHWDHAGGNVTRDDDGSLHPTFPRAEYIVQQADWQEATHQHERNRGSYRDGDFQTIQQRGQLRLVNGEVALTPNLHVERVGGHTAGMHIVHLEAGGRHLVFLADLVPTVAHLDYPWIMGYDLYPVDTLKAKKLILPRAVEENWIVAFVHDPLIAFARVTFNDRRRPVMAPL
jgi:glyoxylase-like metal-dependent hydrolase (beta-lactamase superfamily II)